MGFAWTCIHPCVCVCVPPDALPYKEPICAGATRRTSPSPPLLRYGSFYPADEELVSESADEGGHRHYGSTAAKRWNQTL